MSDKFNAVANRSTTSPPVVTAPEKPAHQSADEVGPSVREQLIAMRPKSTPDWVKALRPLNPVVTGKDGWRLLVGSWPGDETDEEVEWLLKQIDDEDAGRV